MDHQELELPAWADLSSPEAAQETLNQARVRIDEIDSGITRLLNDRARVVEIIGQAKQRLTLRVYEPKREQEVMANVARCNAGPLSDDALSRVYERIMDEMRNLQRGRIQSKEGAGQ